MSVSDSRLGSKSNILKWFSRPKHRFFSYEAEIPAFHTHFVDFGGVDTHEKGSKPQNKENSSEIKGFGRFLGGEKLDFNDFHEFGRKSVLTAPKWSEKRQEFKKNIENTTTTQNRA